VNAEFTTIKSFCIGVMQFASMVVLHISLWVIQP